MISLKRGNDQGLIMSNPKIDEAVAREVMGWTFNRTLLVWVPPGSKVTLADICSKREWRPTEDYNCTAKVVHRILHEINFSKHGGMTGIHHSYNPYAAQHIIKFDWSDDKYIVASHEDYRLAVCEAALKAVRSLKQ